MGVDDDLLQRVRDRLSGEQSAARRELAEMAFDAVTAQPCEHVLGDPELSALVFAALTPENTRRALREHVLPGLERGGARLSQSDARLGDALPESARYTVESLVAQGRGPRFDWLRGAVDPADLRQLVAPVVQQVLVSFTAKLPIPGVSGPGGSRAAGLGGFAERLSKQVSRSAGQLADVGRSFMGGLGAEFERRVQTLARDFSQTAIAEFRVALAERLKSEEGQAILQRMRTHAVAHVMQAPLSEATRDLLRTPVEELAEVAPEVVAHGADWELVQQLIQGELQAALDVLGERTLAELLLDAGLFDETRGLVLRALDPGLRALFESERFGAWLERLLEE